MKDMNDCLGLPLIALDTSDELGVVTHFITDPMEGRVVALASSSSPFADRQALLFTDVQAFGVDAIIVKSAQSVRPISQVNDIQSFLDDPHEKRVRRAVSSEGRNLGTLIDWSFEERSAEVVRYRLEPLNGGEPVWVPHSAFVRSGKAVVILNPTDTHLPPSGTTTQGGAASGSPSAVGRTASPAAAPSGTAAQGNASFLADAAPSPAVEAPLPNFLTRTPEPTPAVTAPPVEAATPTVAPSAPVYTPPPPPVAEAPVPTPVAQSETPAPTYEAPTQPAPTPTYEAPVQETSVQEAPAPVATYEAPAEAAAPVAEPVQEETAPAETASAPSVAELPPLNLPTPEPETLIVPTHEPLPQPEPVAAEPTNGTLFAEPAPEVQTAPSYVPPQPTVTPEVPAYTAPPATTLEAPVGEIPVQREPAPSTLQTADEDLPSAPAMDKPVAEQLKDAINRNEELMIPLVVDKYSDRDILDEQGNWIVQRGQKITSDVAQLARRSWKLYDLWIAAQSSPPAES